jgi:hypothetical protein
MSLAALVVSLVLLSPGQAKPEAAKAYVEILQKHVKNGRIDYKGLARDASKLDAYLKAVADASVPKDMMATIAFYVDAYNANVLRAIVAHRLPNDKEETVLDVKGFFDGEKHKVAGKEVTLNQLEKDVLNPFAKDPRTHMVLVCGAIGCPILDPKPLSGSDVNARLDEAAKRYLSGPTGLVAGAGTLTVSKIFDWYKADFGGPDGALQFIKKYAPPAALEKAGPTPKVSYIEYNWTLNAQ